MTVRAARRIPDLKPGDPDWMRMMTASKVAAVLGLSPWTSRFTLWHEMAGYLIHEAGTVNTQRGLYLEDAVCRWWSDQYVDLRIGKTGSWVNKARPWQSATPDRLVWSGRKAVAVLEVKTSAEYSGWGADGSDEIPAYYRVQVLWQLDTLGLPVGHVAVLLPRLAFRAYAIHYDREEVAWVREQVADFLDTLPGGPNEEVPDLDSTDSTWEAIRRLHPDINGTDVEIPLDVAQRFVDSFRDADAADLAKQAAKNEMAQLLGGAQRGVITREGQKPLVIATRQAKGSGVPYVAAKRPLPELSL